MLTLFFFEMFKVAFQPLYRHVHTEETSKRAETYNQWENSHIDFWSITVTYVSFMKMHCPFKKNKQKRREKQRSVARHSNRAALSLPHQAMTTSFYCKQHYYLWQNHKVYAFMKQSHDLEKKMTLRSSWTTRTECTVITLALHATEACFHGLVLAQGMRRSAYRNDQTDHSYR